MAAVLALSHLVAPDPNKRPVGEEGCVSRAFSLLQCPLFPAEATGSWSATAAVPAQCGVRAPRGTFRIN